MDTTITGKCQNLPGSLWVPLQTHQETASSEWWHLVNLPPFTVNYRKHYIYAIKHTESNRTLHQCNCLQKKAITLHQLGARMHCLFLSAPSLSSAPALSCLKTILLIRLNIHGYTLLKTVWCNNAYLTYQNNPTQQTLCGLVWMPAVVDVWTGTVHCCGQVVCMNK